MRYAAVLLTLMIGAIATPAAAQHTVDLQRLSSSGEHFKVLTLWQQMPRRKAAKDAHLAVARSSWALSLPEQASEYYDRVLRSESLKPEEFGAVNLSRGIIEFQEGKFQTSALFAQRAAESLPKSSPLRAQALGLWGEALLEVGSPAEALPKLEEAAAKAHPEQAPEFHFDSAKALVKLARWDDAKKHLESIPRHHELTAAAMRMLAVIGLEQREPAAAAFWLSRGRQEYPDAFLDSWVDYGLVLAAIQADEPQMVETRVGEAVKRLPPSDHWLMLLDAAAEAYYWERSKR